MAAAPSPAKYAKTLANRAEMLKFKALKRARSKGFLLVEVDRWLYNRPNSPLYKALPNILPLVVLIVLSLGLLIGCGLWAGLPAFLLSAVLYVLYVKLYWERQVEKLVLQALFRTYGGFEFLWATGGLKMRLSYNPYLSCKAPDGDWKNFAVCNLSRLMVADGGPPPNLKMPPAPPSLSALRKQAEQAKYGADEDESFDEEFMDRDGDDFK